MNQRRRRGRGTVEQMRDGRWRARLPGAGKRLEPCDSKEEALRLLDAALVLIEEGSALDPNAPTLQSFGPRWLDQRELMGTRSIGTDRSRWRCRVSTAPFVSWPLSSIRPRDIRTWARALMTADALPGRGAKAPDRKIGRSTAQNALNLLRCCLEAAVDEELIPTNPARMVRLPKSKGRTHEPWTYLLPFEQTRLLTTEEISLELRCLIAFALGTGAREGEIWNLAIRDVDVDRGVIAFRYGSNGKPRKNGLPLLVPILPLARWALETWLPLLRDRVNPNGLVWPTLRGCRRQPGKPPRGWRQALKLASLTPELRHDGQRVRFHDLRHTTASSLVSGWWGEPWTLEQVGGLLGHKSRDATERYAHLAPGALARAAARVDLSAIHPQINAPVKTDLPAFLAPQARIELATNGLGTPDNPEIMQELQALRGLIDIHAKQARNALEALAAGSVDAWRLAIDALRSFAEGPSPSKQLLRDVG